MSLSPISDKMSSAQSTHSELDAGICDGLPELGEADLAFNVQMRQWQGVQLPLVPREAVTVQGKIAEDEIPLVRYLMPPHFAVGPMWNTIPAMALGLLGAAAVLELRPESYFGGGILYQPMDKVTLPLILRRSLDDESLSSFSGSTGSGNNSPTMRLPLSNVDSRSSSLSEDKDLCDQHPQDIQYYAYSQGNVPLPVQLAPYESRNLLPNADPAESLSFFELRRLRLLAAVHSGIHAVTGPMIVPAVIPENNAYFTPAKPKSGDSSFEAPTQKPTPKFNHSETALQPLLQHSTTETKTALGGYRKYIRVYRCKQCEYVAKSKDDYWYHSRVHIKVHKMLSCPKCLFVTEHKHHLEYHLRNHFGSKPFKCPKCVYSCVNNSMLKSHMKSHTTHCEYQCADCNYATKYCHSLKLHLRKRGHKPANEEVLVGFRKWSAESSAALSGDGGDTEG